MHLGGHARHVGGLGRDRGACRGARGLPLGTEQKPQPRVQRLPRIMKVAAPRWKHSWILGQRADSQTVCRLQRRRPLFRRLSDSKCVRLLRAHSGRRARGAAGRGRRSGPANRSRYFQWDGSRRFPARFGAAHGCVSCTAPPARAPGCSDRAEVEAGKPLSFRVLDHDFGIALAERHDLPVRARRRSAAGPRGRRRGGGRWLGRRAEPPPAGSRGG